MNINDDNVPATGSISGAKRPPGAGDPITLDQEGKQPTPKARVTVIQSLVYQSPSERISVAEARYGRNLESGEGLYVRPKLKVTDTWQRVDLGWLNEGKCSLLSLTYELPQLQRRPSAEQLKEILSRKVLVGCSGMSISERHIQPFAILPPGEGVQFEPIVDCYYWLFCVVGEALLTLTAVPR